MNNSYKTKIKEYYSDIVFRTVREFSNYPNEHGINLSVLQVEHHAELASNSSA